MSINRDRLDRTKRAVAGVLGHRCTHCEQPGRWARYLDEALAGRLEAACGPCNRRHGGGLRYPVVDRTRQGSRRRAA